MATQAPTLEQLQELWKVCRAYVDEQPVRCAESIYQCDWISESSLEFIENMCKVVGYHEDENDAQG